VISHSRQLRLVRESKPGMELFKQLGIHPDQQIDSIAYPARGEDEGADAVSGFLQLVRLRGGGRSKSNPRGAQHRSNNARSTSVDASKHRGGRGKQATDDSDTGDDSDDGFVDETDNDEEVDDDEGDDDDDEEEEEAAHSGAGISVDSDGNPVEVDSDGEPIRRSDRPRQNQVRAPGVLETRCQPCALRRVLLL
jgi:hypothetical protein